MIHGQQPKGSKYEEANGSARRTIAIYGTFTRNINFIIEFFWKLSFDRSGADGMPFESEGNGEATKSIFHRMFAFMIFVNKN